MAGVWVLFICGGLCVFFERLEKGNGVGGWARLAGGWPDNEGEARRGGSCGEEMVIAGYYGGPAGDNINRPPAIAKL